MLQGLRVNDDVPAFHLEYLRFELKYFDKIMARKEILTQPSKVDFIDHDVGQDDKPTEQKEGEEANLVRIAWANLKERFGSDVLLMRKARDVMVASAYLGKASA